MNIDQFVDLAKRVHDAEGMNFGSSSKREDRNRLWERIVGIAHWGHPKYNRAPDKQWCIKNAGGGRPQSDDVVVSVPSRKFWDCIPGAGADGYWFQANGHCDEALPSVQEVYAPRKPQGYVEVFPPVELPNGPPVDPPPSVDLPLTDVLTAMKVLVLEAQKQTQACEALVALVKSGDTTALTAQLSTLTNQLDRGFKFKAKGGWAVGEINGDVNLKDVA